MFMGPWDPHRCIEYGLLPVWSLWSYAVRAVGPYSIGGPAGSHPLWMGLFKKARALLGTRGALLLDIRTSEEYEEFHFEGAILVSTPPPPLSAVEIDDLRERLLNLLCQPHIRPYRPIVTYCANGIRAGIAAELLRQAGFLHAFCVGGTETMPLRKLVEYDDELCP